jgi:hypothetical protein
MGQVMKYFTRNISNIPGWRTSRKLVVFDSDDWGSLGMRSREDYHKLSKTFPGIADDPYIKYDSIESEEDLSSLFEVLSRFNDKWDCHPIFTANYAVANPDFRKIAAVNFEKYEYETFDRTLKRYPDHGKSYELSKVGINNRIFYPQFHCREHLLPSLWLRDIKSGYKYLKVGFENEMILLPERVKGDNTKIYNSAYYPELEEDVVEIAGAIKDGLSIFKSLFGYESRSFIATGYIWGRSIESLLSECGIKYIKGIPIQREPEVGSSSFKRRFNYTGKMNSLGQIHIVRNCYFEPTLYSNRDAVDYCLKGIERAFKWHKPAIICTHRLNYIGYIHPENRGRNLKRLEQLLQSMLSVWPDIEFITVDKLGDSIKS